MQFVVHSLDIFVEQVGQNQAWGYRPLPQPLFDFQKMSVRQLFQMIQCVYTRLVPFAALHLDLIISLRLTIHSGIRKRASKNRAFSVDYYCLCRRPNQQPLVYNPDS
jgi:hypothetical protein